MYIIRHFAKYEDRKPPLPIEIEADESLFCQNRRCILCLWFVNAQIQTAGF